jgi:DNA-binding transcriptional regulator YiaG
MPLLRDKQKRNKVRHELYESMATTGVALPTVVKSLRKMLNKDQAEFAEYIGNSLTTLRKIEQNRGNVTMASVRKILDRFALDLVVKLHPADK